MGECAARNNTTRAVTVASKWKDPFRNKRVLMGATHDVRQEEREILWVKTEIERVGAKKVGIEIPEEHATLLKAGFFVPLFTRLKERLEPDVKTVALEKTAAWDFYQAVIKVENFLTGPYTVLSLKVALETTVEQFARVKDKAPYYTYQLKHYKLCLKVVNSVLSGISLQVIRACAVKDRQRFSFSRIFQNNLQLAVVGNFHAKTFSPYIPHYRYVKSPIIQARG